MSKLIKINGVHFSSEKCSFYDIKKVFPLFSKNDYEKLFCEEKPQLTVDYSLLKENKEQETPKPVKKKSKKNK